MRIAVFTRLRAGSTLITHMASKRFELENFNSNINTRNSTEMNPYKILMFEDNYILKIFPIYFTNVLNRVDFDWKMFDYVFITQRQNLTDQVASLIHLRHNNNETHIDFSNEKTKRILDTSKAVLPLFLKEKQKILATHKNAYVIEYEGLQNNPVEYLNSVTNLGFTEEHYTTEFKSKNSNYQNMFDNYNELQQLVDSWQIKCE